MSEKIKSLLSPLKPTKNRIISMILWVAYGAIADLVLEAVVWFTSNGKGWGRLEVGFRFYMGHDTTGIAYDDLILLTVSIAVMLSKRFYKGLGFFLGFYISSVTGLYDKLNLPKPSG